MELIAAKPNDDSRPEIMAAPIGLDGLVFGTEDATATYEALRRNEVPIEPPQQFSRPVTITSVGTSAGHGDETTTANLAETRDATFRTTRLPRTVTPAGRLYFCQHLTRDLVWRDEWRHHANGAVGIARAVIAAEQPASLGALFASMFGAQAVRPADDGYTLILGLSRFDVVTPMALWEMFGQAAPESRGRRDYMAALTVRTLSLDAVETALEGGGIRGWDRIGASVLVPAGEAFGVTIEFSV
jgi:hypothetical protein